MDNLSPGTILDSRFKILSRVGEGTTGVVYEARHLLMDRTVAVKMLHSRWASNPQMLKRFQLEAKAVSSLTHPNIIRVYDFAVLPTGEGYLVMDFLQGKSLADLLKSGGRLVVPDAIDIFFQCCEALSYAHKNAVVHRDIKPGNIFLVDTEEGKRSVRLVDFGIAKIFDEDGGESQRLTQSGEIFGSPDYMSPEQAFGRTVDARSDIYSLGCVMYQCLTGRTPHTGNSTAEIVSKHQGERPPAFKKCYPEAQVPNWLEEIIFKTMEKDASARPQSADELKEELERAASGRVPGNRRSIAAVPKKGLAGLRGGRLPPAFSARALFSFFGLLLAIGLGAVWLTRTDDGALFSARLALTLEETKGSTNDIRVLKPMRNLLACYLRQGHYGEALDLAQQMLRMIKDRRDSESLAALIDLGDFGCARETTASSDKAVSFLKELNDTESEAVISLDLKQDYRTAIKILLQKLLIVPKVAPGNQEEPLMVERRLGENYWGLHDSSNAIACMKKVADFLLQPENLKQLMNIDLLTSIQTLADYYKLERDFRHAEERFDQALKIIPATFGEIGRGADRTALLYDDLVRFYFEQGKLAEARRWAGRSVAVWMRSEPREPGRIVYALDRAAEMAGWQKDLPSAERWYKQAAAICADDGADPISKYLLADSSRNMAMIYNYCGHCAEGKELFEKTVSLRAQLPGDHSHTLAIDMRDLANIDVVLKDYAAAGPMYSKAISTMEKSKDNNVHDLVNLLHSQANFFVITGRFAEAEPVLKRALSLCDNAEFSSQPERAVCLDYYSQVLAATGRPAESKIYLARSQAISKH